MVAANSVVTKEYPHGNCLLMGVPVMVKKPIAAWYEYQGGRGLDKVVEVEKLRNRMRFK